MKKKKNYSCVLTKYYFTQELITMLICPERNKDTITLSNALFSFQCLYIKFEKDLTAFGKQITNLPSFMQVG